MVMPVEIINPLEARRKKTRATVARLYEETRPVAPKVAPYVKDKKLDLLAAVQAGLVNPLDYQPVEGYYGYSVSEEQIIEAQSAIASEQARKQKTQIFTTIFPDIETGKVFEMAETAPDLFLDELRNRKTSTDDVRSLLLAMGAEENDIDEIAKWYESPSYVFDYEKNKFAQAAPEDVAEREQYYEQFPTVGPPGAPGKVTPEQYDAQINAVFSNVFPDLDMNQVIETASEDFDTFLEAVKSKGRNQDTEALLRLLGLEDQDIEQIFTPKIETPVERGLPSPEEAQADLELAREISQAILARKDQPKPGLLEMGKSSLIAGVGDVLNTAGGTARWLGFDDIGEKLSTKGMSLQAQEPPNVTGEFDTADLLNPEFYATKIARPIPFALSMLPVAIGAYAGGAAIAAAAGLGAIGSMVIGGLAAGALSRPLESALEAGGQYDDAIARGKTEAEAKTESDEVFRKNMTLAGADAFEIAIALAPTPKWVPKSLVKAALVRTARIGGKMVIVGLSEGGEEVYQDMVQRHARGEEWKLDAVSKEVFAIGAVMGLGMGLGGDAVSNIVNRSKSEMTGPQRQTFEQAIVSGKTEMQALNEVAKTPEGRNLIQQIINDEQGSIKLPGREPEGQKPGEPSLEPPATMPEPPVAPVSEIPLTAERPVESAQAAPEIPKAEPRPAAIVPPPNIPNAPAVTEAMPIPPDAGATQRVFDRISFDPQKPSVKDKLVKGLREFNTKMIDDLNPLDRFVDEALKGGVDLKIDENPYLMARLLRGVASKANVFLEQGTFGKQFWKTEKGKAVPNFTGKGLEQILQPVKNPTDLRDFAIYLTDKRAIELSGRNIETGIDVADAQASIADLESRHANFPTIAKEVYQYENALLNYGKEQGLLSQELLDKLARHEAYVPFFRVMEALQSKGFMGSKMANVTSPVKRIEGSELIIVNPLEGIVKNTYAMISAADRNDIGVMMANLVDRYPQLSAKFERIKTPIRPVAQVTLKELGVDVQGLTAEEQEQVINIFRPSMKTADDEVTVIIDGKRQFYRIDPELKTAILNLERESLGMLGKILATPARTLRAGATLSPDFVMRNPLRDQWSAMVYSKYGFILGVDFLRGVAGIVGKSDSYKLFKMSGAEHSMMVSMDREYLSKTFDEVVRGKGPINYIKHPLELLQIASELTEKATRLGEFNRGIQSGALPLEAGFAARDVALDFAKAGTTAHAINQIVAFFNANIRGWDKMIVSFKEHPARTLLKVVTGITIPSILLYQVNKDDPRWKEIPQWQKDLFWIVFAGDAIIRIPKPFELGLIFGSGPERLMEYLDTQDPAAAKEFWNNFIEAGLPNWLPTAVLPVIENMTNYSFFKGGPIVPRSKEAMPEELQYGRWTSEFSKKIGELVKYSPAKIDNIINAYTGGLGRYAVSGIDAILRNTGISPDIAKPSPEYADIPVLKAFIIRNPYGSSSQSVNQFYDNLAQFQEGEKYLQEMLKAGNQAKFDEYKSKHPELLFTFDYKTGDFYSASARYLRKVAGQLSEIGKKEDEIYKSASMTAEEKKAKIDELEQLKTGLAKRGLNLLIDEAQPLLKTQLTEAEKKLGTVLETAPLLSLKGDTIYDMRKLNSEFSSILTGVTDPQGNKTAESYLEKESAVKATERLPDRKIYQINNDPAKGDTYTEYRQQWEGLQQLNDPTAIYEFLKEYPNASLGNLSRRQAELLDTYAKLSADEQRQFLKDNPELNRNPREEYLRAHPKENAQLAIWGQADALTQQAYDEAQRLINDLDIPDSAISEYLPPKDLAKPYFEYNDAKSEFGSSSWEVQLLKAKNPKLTEWLKLAMPDTPVASLELKVKNAELQREYDALTDKAAREKLKADNPKWVDDLRRIEAIENKGEQYADKWAERGEAADEFGPSSAEAKLWFVDNPEAHRWALDNNLVTDDGAKWNVPALRLDAKWRKEDAEYDALPATGISRSAYLADNEEYRKDRRRREAYQKGLSDQVENYVTYYEMPAAGYRQERFLFENPQFAEALGLKVPDRVPSEQYDILLEKPDRTPQEDLKMAGYKLYVPDKHIQSYADYYGLLKAGKPPGQSLWYDDDWYLLEHPEFYKDVYLGTLKNQGKNFQTVPSRKVFAKYQTYAGLTLGDARDDYRRANLDLDDWLVLKFGYAPIGEKKTQAKPTKASSPSIGEATKERLTGLIR